MAMDVADFMLHRLRERGVQTVFGYAGDGINGLLAARDRTGNEPEFVQARHEDWPCSRRSGTPSSVTGSGCARPPPPPGPGRSNCSTGSTTRGQTTESEGHLLGLHVSAARSAAHGDVADVGPGATA
jgi:hypothetical protein